MSRRAPSAGGYNGRVFDSTGDGRHGWTRLREQRFDDYARSMVLRHPKGLIALFVLGLASVSLSIPDAAIAKAKTAKKKKKNPEDEKEFQARLATLKQDQTKLIIVKMTLKDDPTVLPAQLDPMQGGGPVMVASNRQLVTPDTLSPGDIKDVINRNIVDVRKCYKKQLQADPEWSDELILDLAIKKSGRVSEVGIEPRRVRTDVIGVCLLSAVPRWKFPKFTGEGDDGVNQDVVSASFPFTLTQK
jgi:hypothetical protein